MARPVNADAAATRSRILESALALFAEHGLAAVSIRRIASASGVSLAMVHHYYGSKDALHEACINSMYDRLGPLQDELATQMSTAKQPGELIGEAVRTSFRFARKHQVAGRLLLRQVISAGELDPARRKRVQEPFLATTTQLLGRLVNRPAAQFRLAIQSIVFLIARYGVSTDAELEFLTGKKGKAATRAAQDHLVRAASGLLT